jgi:Flp pilus assembly protein protease CpaA
LSQDVVGFFASLIFQLTGKVNVFGWSSLAIYGVLALAYAYYSYQAGQMTG